MLQITFTSEKPAVQRLIDAYNKAERAADPDRLQETLDGAEEMFNPEMDEGILKELSNIMGFCRMALAELDFATAKALPGRPEVDAHADNGLAAIRKLE